MEFRNPKFSTADNSLIDVEINHPNFGWIPHTVDAAENPELDAKIKTAGNIAAFVPDPVIPDPPPFVDPVLEAIQVIADTLPTATRDAVLAKIAR